MHLSVLIAGAFVTLFSQAQPAWLPAPKPLPSLRAVSAPSGGQDAQEKRVYKPSDPGVKAPRLVKETKPKYTSQAMRDGAQGLVMMSAIVTIEGKVEDVKVTQPLHPELDEEAVKALKNWRFSAGTLDGKPVPVEVEIEMTFTLKSSRR